MASTDNHGLMDNFHAEALGHFAEATPDHWSQRSFWNISLRNFRRTTRAVLFPLPGRCGAELHAIYLHCLFSTPQAEEISQSYAAALETSHPSRVLSLSPKHGPLVWASPTSPARALSGLLSRLWEDTEGIATWKLKAWCMHESDWKILEVHFMKVLWQKLDSIGFILLGVHGGSPLPIDSGAVVWCFVGATCWSYAAEAHAWWCCPVAGINPSSPGHPGGCKTGHQIWFGMEKGWKRNWVKFGHPTVPFVRRAFVFHWCPTTIYYVGLRRSTFRTKRGVIIRCPRRTMYVYIYII